MANKAPPAFAPGYGFIPVPGGPMPQPVRLSDADAGEFQPEGAAAPGAAQPMPGAIKLTAADMADFQEAPGEVETALRSAGQGITSGLSDEIIGGVESLFSDKTYEQAKAESSAANAAAKLAHPEIYMAGEIAGGLTGALVPGLGLAKGAGIAAKAGLAAAEGAVAGFGYSEAKDLKTLIRDTATGALLGGAVGGTVATVGKAVGGGLKSAARRIAESAPDRAKKRIVTSIVESTNPKPRNNLIGKAGERADEVGDFVLKDDLLFANYRNQENFLAAVQQRIDEVDPALDALYPAIDKVSKGVDLKPVKSVFDRVIKDAESAYSPRIADAIRTKRNQVMRQLMGDVDFTPAEFLSARSAITLPANAPKLTRKAIDFQVDELAAQVQDWVKARGRITIGDMDTLSSELLKSSGKRLPPSLRGPVAQAFDDMIAEIASKQKVPAAELRTITRRLQKDGFDNVDIMNVTEMKAAAQDVGMGMRELLNQHIENVGGKAGIADAADIRALNKRMSMLLDLRAAAEPSAKRARGATQVAPFSLKNLKLLSGNPVNQAVIAALDPTGIGQGAVAARYAVRGAEMLDDQLAKRGAGAAQALGQLPGLDGAGQALRSAGAREAGSLPARAGTGAAEAAPRAAAASAPAKPSDDEAEFQRWYAGVAKSMDIDPNPDAPEHFYDYRGFFKAVKSGKYQTPTKKGGHFPSDFKLEGHPRNVLADPKGRRFDTRTGRYLDDGSAVPDHVIDGAENAPTLQRKRAASVADLAGMARKGASIDAILAEADRSGVSPAKAQQIARLFGPR